MADLDEDEFYALDRAVRDRLRDESWTNTHELLATIAHAIWQVSARLDAGVPVGMVAQLPKPEEPEQYPRPEWIKAQEKDHDDGVVVVRHVRDALTLIKGGGEGTSVPVNEGGAG